MKTRIVVTLKKGILDPQGKAVENALHSLGFEGAGNVRVGKFIEMEFDGGKKEAEEMCKKLLANPVTEDYEIIVDGKA